jgi:hypothetical protein
MGVLCDQNAIEALTRDIEKSAEVPGIQIASCKIRFDPSDLLVTVVIEAEGRAGVFYRADYDLGFGTPS